MKVTNKIKKYLLIATSSMLCFSAAAIGAFTSNIPVADAQDVPFSSFEMASGASVYLGGTEKHENGIRWQIKMDSSEYSAMSKAYTNVQYGILVAPEDYLTENKGLTVENVFGSSEKDAIYDWAVKDEQGNWVYDETSTKTRIMNFTTDVLYQTTRENADYVEFFGAIIGLKDGTDTTDTTNNLAREFRGVGYVRYTENNVEKFKLVGDEDNVRSMAYVAQLVQEDKDVSDTDKALLQNIYLDKVASIETKVAVNAYKENATGEYVFAGTTWATAKIGETLTISANDYVEYGYTVNAEKSKLSTIAYANDNAELSVYYDMKDYMNVGLSVELDKYAYSGANNSLRAKHLEKTSTVQALADANGLNEEVKAVFDVENFGVNLLDSNGKIDLSNASVGANEFVLYTENNNGYSFAANVVTMVIYDADDLEAVKETAGVGEAKAMADGYTYYDTLDGYYVLANDVDYENREFGLTRSTANTQGFIGTFDGRGHVISNIKVADGSTGLFGNVGTAGVIKNVAFVNVQNTANNDHGDGYNRRNLLCYTHYGTIENVYVEGTRGTISGAFSGAIGQCVGATVHNVVAIITETGNKNTSNVCLGAVIGAHGNTKPTADTIKNLIGVSKYYPVVATNTWSDWEKIGTNVYGYGSVEAVNATYSTEDWDTSIWNISNGLPIFKNMVWLNDWTERASVLNYDLSNANAQEFSLAGITGEVVSVTKDDGTEVGNWSFADGKLTLTPAFATEMLAGKAYGDVVVRFNVESEAGKAEYRAKFAFVTKVIYDADDLEEVMSIATKDATFGGGDYYTDVAQKADGYYVLANNIDFANGEFGLTHGSTGDGFIGIFDGRGYVVSNIAVKYESVGLFGQIGKAGVVRNVAFVGVTNTTNKANADYVRRNILAFVAKGKIENVYVEATRSTSIGSFSGVIGQCDGATVHNVVAIITETGNKNTSGTCLGSVIGAHGNTKPTADTIKNLIGVSKYYPVVATNTWSDWEKIGTNVYGYGSVEAVNATYSAEDWDTSIWNISNGIPIFKNMAWVNDWTEKASVGYYDLSVANAQELRLAGITGEVVSVAKDDGTEVGNWSFADGKLTLTPAFATEMLAGKAYGDVVVRFNVESEAGKAEYRAKIAFATKVIYDADDLEAVKELGCVGEAKTKADGYKYYDAVDGYYVLANNVDYENREFGLTNTTNGDQGFIGIFEGNGYTISNIKVADGPRGLFGLIGKTGVVRNVAFVNLQNTEDNAHGEAANSRCMLAYICYGKIENVYVGASRGEVTGNFSGAIGQWQNTSTVKNFVVVIEEKGSIKGRFPGAAIALMWNNASEAAPVKNIVAVSSLTVAIGPFSNYEKSATNVQEFKSVAEANGTYSAEDWDTSIWNISGGVPVFNSMKTA